MGRGCAACAPNYEPWLDYDEMLRRGTVATSPGLMHVSCAFDPPFTCTASSWTKNHARDHGYQALIRIWIRSNGVHDPVRHQVNPPVRM